MVGESPSGTSVLFSSACAIPYNNKRAAQIKILFIIAIKKGDTVVSPFLIID